MSNDKVDATFHPGKEPWIMSEIERAAEREPQPEPTFDDLLDPPVVALASGGNPLPQEEPPGEPVSGTASVPLTTQSMSPDDPTAVPHAHMDEH